MREQQGGRTLTDADVDAITARLESRFQERFVRGAGIGVLRLAWKGLTYLIVGLAVYAWTHHGGTRP
jgi:hypothetical protein